MKKEHSKEQQKDIEETAAIIKLCMIDNQPKQNRCHIWKEIRNTGMRGDLCVEVMRELGLFKG